MKPARGVELIEWVYPSERCHGVARWVRGGPYLQGANQLRGRFVMSRKDELLKLAELFHSQAKLTLSRDAKQALQKIGDHYKCEAEQLRTQVSFERRSSARNFRHHKSVA